MLFAIGIILIIIWLIGLAVNLVAWAGYTILVIGLILIVASLLRPRGAR
ncbi:MAG TPA: hypothetical protein VFK07_03350 [Candidatus Paceibacterota bacterium]|nr:hypothetical protein [Candidatus Paceibacterota bacterium]